MTGKVGPSLLSLCILLSFTSLVDASTFVTPTDQDMIISSRAIIRGKVLGVTCQLDDATGSVFSYIRVRVREVFKGQITEPEVVIREEGGQFAGRGTTVFGAPQFKEGEKVLLYLDTRRDGSLRVHQMFLGKFRIVDDQRTGQSFVVRDMPDAALVRADRSITNRAEVSAYTSMIQQKLAERWQQSLAFEQTYYSGVPLLNRPPEYKSRSGEVQPQFTYITTPCARWFEPDTGQPVNFLVNPEGAPNAQIMDDIAAAMNQWSAVSGCTMRVASAGTTGNCASGQTTVIQFNNCDDRWSAGTDCSGVLALGGLNWDSSFRKQVNGTTFVKVVAAFVSFNPYASCSFAEHCNVQEIATHEIGHALGLGHSVDPIATMYATAHFDGRCASLKQDDVDGITYAYPVHDDGLQPLSINTDSLPMGIVGAAYSTTVLNGTGGARPHVWSVVAGLGRPPNGLQFNAGGLIGGVPLETGTFGFTVELRDANSTTVRRPYSISVITPSGPYDSQFISQTVPVAVLLNQPFTVSMKFLNLGSQIWDSSSGLTLRAQNPTGNTTWGGSAMSIGSPIVTPGKQLEVALTLMAPRSFGTYNFQWQLYQELSGYFGQATANVSITVTDGSSPPTISSPSTIDALAGATLNYQLTVSAGSAPFTWSLAAGSLPPGLTLNSSTGVISGAPPAAGASTATLQVTDAQNRTAQKSITVNVATPPLSIATGSMPQAQKGAPYILQLAAIGGKAPYTWSVTGLPAGLGIASATGIISGTPSVTGTFSITATATDADSRTTSRVLSITVVPPPLSLGAVPQLEAVKGTAFSYQLSAAGGSPPYTWLVSSGALPAGLSLNPATGAISGVPTVFGSFTLSVTVRDQASLIATTPIQMRVLDPETIPAIRKVKYKGHKKLTVTGDRFNAAAVLLVDGVQLTAVQADGAFVVKPIALSTGRHEIKVINPGAILSQPVVIDVD